MPGEPAPKAVLDLLSCDCKILCKLPSCSCLVKGLRCTDMCQLKDCTKQPEEQAQNLPMDDSADDCEDN